MTTPSAPPSIWLLIACAGISQLAMTLVLPANTVIRNDLGAEYGVAQLMLTTFLIAMGIAQLLTGYLSDRHGRRVVLLAGFFVFTIGSLICGLASSVEILLFGRVLQGIGAAAAVAVPRAIVRDVYSRARGATVMSYLLLAMGIVPMISPLIGGLLLGVLPWRSLFFLMAAISIGTAVSIYLYLPETRPTGSVTTKPVFTRSALVLLVHPAYIGYTMSFVFGTAMYHAFNAGAPYLMAEVLQRKPAEFGLYFAMAAAMFLVASLLSARISEKVGADRMIVLALIPIAMGIALFWLLRGWAHPFALFFPAGLLMFSNGLTVPNAITGAQSVYPELAGTAAGIGGFIQYGVGALMSMAVGFLIDDFGWALLVALFICGSLAAVGAVLGIRSRRDSGSFT